jgi:hypothetical protein
VPERYGKWETVYGLFRRWQRDGTWARWQNGGVMVSLYDRIAARPGGLSDLATARLRRRILVLVSKAMDSAGFAERELAPLIGMSVRKLRRILNGNGDIKVSLLAELLHATGYEAEVRLAVGEPRTLTDDQDELVRGSDRPCVGVGMPAMLRLEAFGFRVFDAFGDVPYLVGSAAVSKKWRDVDVRLILDDDVFAGMFPGYARLHQHDLKWSLLCDAISELAHTQTGLPVDFQIQAQTDANERYEGPRYPLGIRITE